MNAYAVSFAALALGATALVVALLDFPAAAPVGGRPALPEAGAVDGAVAARLLARLDDLAENQRTLAERLARLEVQVTSGPRKPAATSAVSAADLEALRDEVRAVLAGGASPNSRVDEGLPSPEFTERVARSMRAIRVEEATEDARRTVAWRSARLAEKLPDVARDLGLTAQQESSLESSLRTLYERRANHGVLWASGEVVEKSEFRELDAAHISAFLTDLAGFLSPQQLQGYLALQGDLFPGGEAGGGSGEK